MEKMPKQTGEWVTSDESGDSSNPFEKKEIERKFLIDIDKIPGKLRLLESKKLVAGYLPEENGKKLRIRKEGDRYFKVTKGERTENRKVANLGVDGDVEISREEFDELWPKTKGARLKKTRFYIPVGEYVGELDVYYDFAKSDFFTIEIEFQSLDECNKFVPPKWFDREVTHDEDYSSRSLAVKGLPKSFKK